MYHLEGDSMHSMITNDERFYDKYEKLRHDCRPMKNITWKGYVFPPRGRIWELEETILIGEIIGALGRGQVS